MVEGSKGPEAPRQHGTAGDEDERTVINFAELPEEEPGESGEPQFVPEGPIPHDLPVPDLPDPPEPGSPDPSAAAGSSGTDVLAPPVEEAPAAALRGLTPAPILDESFPAADFSSFIPPDAAGAAGPNHLVVAHNGVVRIQDKTGLTISSTSLNAFWGVGGGGGFAFDPKVLFDSAWGRWIITSCTDALLPTSALLLGVSAGPDPTGAWYIFRVRINAADAAWADHPSIGFNQQWVVVQVNMFVGEAFSRSHIYVFDKSAILIRGQAPSGPIAGLPQLFTLFSLVGSSGGQVPIVNLSGARPRAMYLLQNWNGPAGRLALYEISTLTGPGVTFPVLISWPLISTAQTWASSAPSRNFGPQLAPGTPVDLGDARIRNNVIMLPGVTEDYILAAHTVFVPASPAAVRSAVQFWVLRTNRTIDQVARLDDGAGSTAPSASTFFYAYPSLAVTPLQSVLIGFARFAADRRPGAGWAYRWGSDPPGTLQIGGIIKSGEGPYVNLDPTSGANRWGDYTSTCLDPDSSQGSAIWTLQQFARTPAGTGTTSGRWGTWWGKVRFLEIG
jgi:hypothetical protein